MKRPKIKTYASGWKGGINNGSAGSLESWIGIGEFRFGEDGHCWVGKKMGQSDWKSLVKDNL